MSILWGRTVLPVVMLAIGACTFAGLSTFQSIYAETRGLSPNVFFLTFTVTTVTLRFSVAGMIGKLPLGRLALTLFVTTLIGIGLLVLNPGSELLYVVATVLFAIGYGLTYSTLNAMVVNLAGERGLSISTASQVFTLAYFRGFVRIPVSRWHINCCLWHRRCHARDGGSGRSQHRNRQSDIVEGGVGDRRPSIMISVSLPTCPPNQRKCVYASAGSHRYRHRTL